MHQFPGRELPLQTASLSSLERAIQHQYVIVVNSKTQMYVFYVVFMQTPAWVLKFLCFFQVMLGKSSNFLHSWCILMFSVWLFSGRHFFQWECCFVSISALEFAYSPSLFCSVPVFSFQCFSLEHLGKEEFSLQRKHSVLPLCSELSCVGAWAAWPNKTCSEKGMAQGDAKRFFPTYIILPLYRRWV